MEEEEEEEEVCVCVCACDVCVIACNCTEWLVQVSVLSVRKCNQVCCTASTVLH